MADGRFIPPIRLTYVSLKGKCMVCRRTNCDINMVFGTDMHTGWPFCGEQDCHEKVLESRNHYCVKVPVNAQFEEPEEDLIEKMTAFEAATDPDAKQKTLSKVLSAIEMAKLRVYMVMRSSGKKEGGWTFQHLFIHVFAFRHEEDGDFFVRLVKDGLEIEVSVKDLVELNPDTKDFFSSVLC